MSEYSIPLAVYDFAPALFTGAALYFLAQLVRHHAPQLRWLAYSGGGLVVLAGVLKASWKLVMALSAQDIVLLSEIMFPLMGPGFAFVAFALWGGLRRADDKPIPANISALAMGIVAVAIALAFISTVVMGNERGYFPVFLMLASISNVGLSIMLIRAALRRGQRGIAGLFFVNIAMVFALQPIAATPDKTMALHWFEQTLTSGGAACFALASYLLWRAAVHPAQLPRTPEPARRPATSAT
ncbi:MAG: hypothetical protein ACLFTK_07690 [Anaerolineales bacterium]